jgi:thioredoxin reductase (NADPH)
VIARALIVTTGMTYREHPAEGVARLTGAGVYYGAVSTEAPACRGGSVMVIGGGNSAGQCAVHLSRYACQVDIVVRREGLQETMSQYLIDQINSIPNIRVRGCTAIQAVEGDERLERVVLNCDHSGVTTEPVDAMFVLIGTKPHSEWLPPSVLRDAKGFVLTGRDAAAAEAFPRYWKESRAPLTLETSVPGVLAAGDVRAGAMNRVASAVGEGAMAVRLAWEYLGLT